MGRVVLHLPGGESEKPYVVGTYVGNGTQEKTISVGFPVQAIFVCGEISEGQSRDIWALRGVKDKYFYFNLEYITGFVWTDVGVSITEKKSSINKINIKNISYYYIAFR